MKIIGITSTAILSLLLGVGAPAYAQHEEQGEKQDHAKQEQGGHEQAGHELQHAQQPQHAQEQQQRAQQQPAQHNEQAQQKQQQQDQHNQQQAQQEQRQQGQHNQHQAQPEQRHQDQHDQQQAQQKQQRQDQHDQQQAQQKQQRQDQHDQQQARDRQPQRTQRERGVQQSAWQEHRSQNWQSDHRDWQQRGGYRGYRIPDDRYRGYFGPSHGFRINGLPFLVVGGYPRFQYQGYWISTVDPWPEYWGNDWYDNDDVYVNYVDNGYYLYNRRYPGEGIAINITL
jgi:hypothetical protein